MEAKDLRINNLVHDAHKNAMAIELHGITFFAEGKQKFYPIPLSEEWLLKFGFTQLKPREEMTGRGKWFKIYQYEIKTEWGISLLIQSEDKKEFYCYINAHRPYIDLKSVHQLQNLYFSLTGQELI